MIPCAKYFDSNKTLSFKVSDKMLKKYIKIWRKISTLMKKEFTSEPIYDDCNKYIQAKIKSYGDKVNVNFQGKTIRKGNVCH